MACLACLCWRTRQCECHREETNGHQSSQQ
jgi:hypothetical protein